jgi:hypothetical protein
MKRLLIGAGLVLGTVLTAHADNAIYTSRRSAGDAELQAAGRACDQQFGAVSNGATTSAPYKRCMAGFGWRYQRTIRGRSAPREHTWIDPETGDTCHDILGGLGSSCGNF